MRKVSWKALGAAALAATFAVGLLPLEEMGGRGTASAAVTLSNPRIKTVTDGSMKSGQKVTWDCVYFGSYPQTEVVSEEDSDKIEALEGMNEYYDTEYEKISAEEFKQIENADYQDLNSDGTMGDATVGTEKYRRIKYSAATYATTGGSDWHYDWTNQSSYHYFKYEPIKWRVLNVSDGKALLLSDVALDGQPYHVDNEDVTWETSTIRSWLNGYKALENKGSDNGIDYSSDNFIGTAFSLDERAAIATITVENADNLVYGTDGGNDTSDQIFLLSETECWGNTVDSYGFVNNKSILENGSINDEGRRCQTSTYAYAMGTVRDYDSSEGKNYAYAGNCWWRLRSPGSRSNLVAGVGWGGNGYESGHVVISEVDCEGIRPALYLDLSSSLWEFAGTVCSDGTVDVKASPGSGESDPVSSNAPVPSDDLPLNNNTFIGGAGGDRDTKVTSIKITVKGKKGKAAKKFTVKAGKKLKLKATTIPAGASVKWTSSKKKYATVNQKGVVKAKKAGKGKTVKITAAATDGSGVKKSIKVKIK